MTYQVVAQLSDLPPNTGKTFRIGTLQVALFNHDGQIYALDGYCPHRGAPLGDGWFEFPIAHCPLHGWDFDVRTGACGVNPEKAAKVLPVRVVGQNIEVLLPLPA